jgi:FkbM family methyltransferase
MNRLQASKRAREHRGLAGPARFDPSGALKRMAYESLIWSAGTLRTNRRTAIWDRAWSVATSRLRGPVVTSLHGQRVLLNAGYAYPAFARRWPTYNDPLVELVHQARVARNSPVGVVDVGAAVGDTVLLLLEKCREDVRRFHCLEGDEEFFSYLESNLGSDPTVDLHFVMLSDAPGSEKELIRTHSGTASAQGLRQRSTTTLDAILRDSDGVDVLKIDTDGFDGKILAGGTELLRVRRPFIIFEWHPLLCRDTGQDWRLPFEVLSTYGYEWFVWFTKEGEFSHIDKGYEASSVAVLAELCLTDRGPRPDWHYDVVALRDDGGLAPLRVAALQYARGCR